MTAPNLRSKAATEVLDLRGISTASPPRQLHGSFWLWLVAVLGVIAAAGYFVLNR